MRMVLVSCLRADNSPKTKVYQISSHETQRVSERIRCKIIDYFIDSTTETLYIDVNDWFEFCLPFIPIANL